MPTGRWPGGQLESLLLIRLGRINREARRLSMAIEQYIKVYEWILRHPDLTRFEALLVCEVLRWPNGCHKSADSLARLLRSNKRWIQRTIKSLEKREWLAVLQDGQLRLLYATPRDPPIGELFAHLEKTKQAMAEKRKKEIMKLLRKTADRMSAERRLKPHLR